MLVLTREEKESVHGSLDGQKALETAMLRASERLAKRIEDIMLTEMCATDFTCEFDMTVAQLSRRKARLGFVDEAKHFKFKRTENWPQQSST